MLFEEALAAMREGKKITKGEFKGDEYISLSNGSLLGNDECPYYVPHDFVCDEDWEIYQNPKWEPEGGEYYIRGDGKNRGEAMSEYAINQLIKEQELKQWSGCGQTNTLEQWLKDQGIRYFKNKKGKIVTTQAACDAALLGQKYEEIDF